MAMAWRSRRRMGAGRPPHTVSSVSGMASTNTPELVVSFEGSAPLWAPCTKALTQAIVGKLHRLYTKNMGFRMYPRALIEENKWRAARWGVEGKLIDFGKQAEVPMRQLGEELLEFVDDVVDDLGSREALQPIHTILEQGTSAERQMRVYKETGGDLKAVVRQIVEETRGGHSHQQTSAARGAGAPNG